MRGGRLTRPRLLALLAFFFVLSGQILTPLSVLAQIPNPTGAIDQGLPRQLPIPNPTGSIDEQTISNNPNSFQDDDFNNPSDNPAGGIDNSIDGGLYAGAVEAGGDPGNVGEPPIEVTMTLIESTIARWIHNIAIMIGGWVAGMGGNFFEYTFDLAVVKLGCQFVKDGAGCTTSSINTNGAIGGVVNELWMIIRDVFNVLFIFGLVFLGLKTILLSDDSGTRRAIANLLLAALLVNFSLYFAKLVLDISNFAAVQIYSAMGQGITCDPETGCYSIADGAGAFSLGAGNKVAGAFMEVLRVASWFTTSPQGGFVSHIVFAILAMIFLIIVGAIFIYGAIMMLTRFIAIVILLIFSPVLFLGFILPNFKSYSDKWRKMFVSYCFFAPAYVFMLYLSLYSLMQLSQSFTGESYGESIGGSGQVTAGTMGIFVFFFIGIGFLLASTKVAAAMSSQGGGFLMQSGEKWARKMSLGAAAIGGGYAASWGLGKTGKYLVKDADAVEARDGKSNIFTRRQRLMGEALQKKKFGGAPSYKEWSDSVDTADSKAARLKSIDKVSSAIKAGTKGDDVAAKIKMEEAISSASNAQILDMAKSGDGMKALQSVAGSLSSGQFKAIMDSTDISDSDKSTLGAKRVASIKTKITNAGKPKEGKPTPDNQFGEGMKSAAANELEALDLENDLIANAIYLQAGQMDDLKKSWGADSTKFGLLKDAQKKAFDEALTGKEYEKIVGSRKGNKEIAKLPDNVLETPEFIKAIKDKLSADLLGHIARESGANKKVVGSNVIDAFGDFDNLPPDIQKFMQSGPGVQFLPVGYDRKRMTDGPKTKQSDVAGFKKSEGGVYFK